MGDCRWPRICTPPGKAVNRFRSEPPATSGPRGSGRYISLWGETFGRDAAVDKIGPSYRRISGRGRPWPPERRSPLPPGPRQRHRGSRRSAATVRRLPDAQAPYETRRHHCGPVRPARRPRDGRHQGADIATTAAYAVAELQAGKARRANARMARVTCRNGSATPMSARPASTTTARRGPRTRRHSR